MKNGLLQSVRLTGVLLLCAGFSFQATAGLRLHYAFDGDLRDRGPSNNVGSISGGVSLTAVPTNVIVGTGALLLDGATSSYVALTNTITFTASNPWSVAFWSRRGETINGYGMVIGCRTNNNDFIWLSDNLPDVAKGAGLRFRNSAGNSYDFLAPRNLKPHHYALVATGGGALSVYIDGVLTSNRTSITTSFLIDSVGKAYGGYEYKGVLDDVRVYDSVLDAGAVSNLYRLGGAVHYGFDGDLSDSGATKNVGTASGTAAVTTNSMYVVTGTGALLLDGGDTSYVALSNALTFAAADAWTAAFWACRSERNNDTGMVLGRRLTTNDFIWLNDTLPVSASARRPARPSTSPRRRI